MRFLGHGYLFRLFLLENNQFLSLLIHLILKSVFFSIQGGDGLVKSSHFLLVLGALLTQLPCQMKLKSGNSHRK